MPTRTASIYRKSIDMLLNSKDLNRARGAIGPVRVRGSAIGTEMSIFRMIGNLYFYIFQKLMGRSLRDFALRSITMHN